MLKKAIKRGIRALKDVVKNEVAVIEAKKEAVKDLISFIAYNPTIRDFLGFSFISIGASILISGRIHSRENHGL